MIRYAIAQWCLDRGCLAAIVRAAGLGFSALQIDAGGRYGQPFISDPALLAQYEQAAREAGINIIGIAVNIMNEYGLFAVERSRNRGGWPYIQGAIDAARYLGANLVFIPSFRQGEIRTDDQLKQAAAALRAAAAYAGQYGITVASENSLGVQPNRALIDLVGCPNFRIVLDTYNPLLWGHRPVDFVRQLGPYLCDQIHAKDGINGVMGSAQLNTGQAQFAETLQALLDSGFDGYIVLENMYGPDTLSQVAADRAALAQLMLEWRATTGMR